MNPGDAVWYRQTCRGGYGYQRDVPAIFVRRAGSRVRVTVQLRNGGTKDISVKPENVRPREVKEMTR